MLCLACRECRNLMCFFLQTAVYSPFTSGISQLPMFPEGLPHLLIFSKSQCKCWQYSSICLCTAFRGNLVKCCASSSSPVRWFRRKWETGYDGDFAGVFFLSGNSIPQKSRLKNREKEDQPLDSGVFNFKLNSLTKKGSTK